MKLIHILIIIMLIILAFLGGMIFQRGELTTLAVKEIEPQEETITKALCNSHKECIDVLIAKKGDEIIKIEPASTTRKFPASWYAPDNP